MEEFKTKEEIIEKIESVLDNLRPFLQSEGGDITVEDFDMETGICYVDMIGACAGCYMASSDVSDSVEVLLMDEIPQIKHVVLVQPEQPTFEDLLNRLKEEEQANKELEQLNRKRQQQKKEDSKNE